jgi:hypothetical protein
MKHPADSTDLALSAFHHFARKEKIPMWQECDTSEATCATKDFLLYYGIKNLVGHWEKCVEKQGDFVDYVILFLWSSIKN